MNNADHDIFSLTPLPCLLGIFTVFKAIWKIVPSVQISQEQLRTLTYCIAELLQILDQQYRNGKLQENDTSDILDDLDKFVAFELCHTTSTLSSQCVSDYFMKFIPFIAKRSHLNFYGNYSRRIKTSFKSKVSIKR